MTFLLPLAAFVAALAAVFWVLPRSRRPHRSQAPRSVWATTWGQGLAAAAGGLVLAAIARGVLGSRVAGLLVAASSVPLIYSGVRVALNVRGDADDVAEAFWGARGMRVPAEQTQARAIGCAAVLVGLLVLSAGAASAAR